MLHKRLIAASATVAAVALGAVLYTAHAVKSSDHQDTYNLATRSNTSADITDVFVFPAPDNAANVVFAMDVSPLIMPGAGTSKFFDPTVLWQFKISHQASGVEDQVIQLRASGTGTSQTISMYGPAAPTQVGTANTILSQAAGSTTYNTSAQLQNNTIQLYAGPRIDPFTFDLFAFFTFLGDRNWGTHTSQTDPGQGDTLYNGTSAANIAALTPSYDKAANPNTPSFNGFAAGTTSNGTNANSPLGNYACSTNPASDTLFAGPFNVLSFVVEVPKALIYGGSSGFTASTIHVWATASSSTGS